MAFCGNCGNEIPTGESTCFACNQAASAAPDASAKTERSVARSFASVLIREAARIVFMIVKSPLITGSAGLLAGIAASFLFHSYTHAHYPRISLFAYAAFSVLYFCAGSTLLWGYAGLFHGLGKAFNYVLFEKNLFSSALSGITAALASYLKRTNPAAPGSDAGSTDPSKTSITFETVRNAMNRFRNTGDDGLASDNSAKKGMLGLAGNLIFRFIMKRLMVSLFLRESHRLFRKRSSLSLAELNDSMMKNMSSSGKEIVSGFFTDKVILFCVLAPIHLLLPFIAAFILMRFK